LCQRSGKSQTWSVAATRAAWARWATGSGGETDWKSRTADWSAVDFVCDRIRDEVGPDEVQLTEPSLRPEARDGGAVGHVIPVRRRGSSGAGLRGKHYDAEGCAQEKGADESAGRGRARDGLHDDHSQRRRRSADSRESARPHGTGGPHSRGRENRVSSPPRQLRLLRSVPGANEKIPP
jgi:hypothetical protein